MSSNRIVKNEPIRPSVYGIGLYFLVACTDSFPIGTIGSFLKIVVLIPLALALFDLKKLQIRFSALVVVQLLLLFLSVISLFYSINTDRTFVSVRTLILNLALVFFFGMMERYNQRELQYMQRALLVSGWVTILMMVLFSSISSDGRLSLLLGEGEQDQNYINGYFLYTFSWHSCQLILQKKKLHFIPVIIIFTIVLLTGSRGALLAFILVLFMHMCILFACSNHKFRNIFMLVLLSVVLLIAFDLILAQMPDSVAKRFSWDYISATGTTGRTRVWSFLLKQFGESSILRMLFGYGYGTTITINTLNGKVAHNLYLEYLLTLGIVGLTLQLLIQILIIRILLKHRQYPLLGAYFGMLGMCMSLSILAYKPIWNIMILALAIDFYEKAKSHSGALSRSTTQTALYEPGVGSFENSINI